MNKKALAKINHAGIIKSLRVLHQIDEAEYDNVLACFDALTTTQMADVFDKKKTVCIKRATEIGGVAGIESIFVKIIFDKDIQIIRTFNDGKKERKVSYVLRPFFNENETDDYTSSYFFTKNTAKGFAGYSANEYSDRIDVVMELFEKNNRTVEIHRTVELSDIAEK